MNREDFCSYMRVKFGLEFHFFGNQENPYGYAIIDHKAKRVIHGRNILPVKELIKNLKTTYDRKEYYNNLVKKILKEKPDATQKEINNELLKMKTKASVSKGYIVDKWNKKKKICQLDEELAKRIQYNNNKYRIINRFRPCREIELMWLNKYYDINLTKEDIEGIAKRDNDIIYYKNYIGQLMNNKNPLTEFHKNQLRIYTAGDDILFYDERNERLITGEDIGLKREQFLSAVEQSLYLETASGENYQYDVPDSDNALINLMGIVDLMPDAGGGGVDGEDIVKKNKRRRKTI